MSLAPEDSGRDRRATRRVKEIGRAIGFDLVRIASPDPLTIEGERFRAWLADGRQGEMHWLTPERTERAASPTSVLEGARSVICVGLSHGRTSSIPPDDRGRIARYAWGGDYHTYMGDKLHEMVRRLEEEFGGKHRAYVDTGPLMDKALGARAGIGWYGKHTNLISPTLGSFFLLGEAVTTLELEPDAPLGGNCGSCRLCQIACPTGALDRDYTIDARRCISYLTIEHRGPIPIELRPLMGSWVFGCDICQDVCPPGNEPYLRTGDDRRLWAEDARRYIRRNPAVARDSPQFPMFGRPARRSVDLIWLLNLDHPTYLEAFRGTAVRRAKVWMLRRNAAVALGNVGDAAALESLAAALTDDNPIVRGHAAWAIGNIGQRLRIQVGTILASALSFEHDEDVRRELITAHCDSAPSPAQAEHCSDNLQSPTSPPPALPRQA